MDTTISDYTENSYGHNIRTTDEAYRQRLVSWQVPAIATHFGSLDGIRYIDIGAGDIVYGGCLDVLGVPERFYVHDLSRSSLETGFNRLRSEGIDTSCFALLSSTTFDFSSIEECELDAAFSNSLFSHLSINSIFLCLRNLYPKMKHRSSYFSSMIILPDEMDSGLPFDWTEPANPGTEVVSHPARDPYHYSAATILSLSNFDIGFDVEAIHDYGHPFQKLVEFHKR